jgi:arylsulfatase A-like enzyme
LSRLYLPSNKNQTSWSSLGDDIGYWNISAYNRGMMGYRTPNIDRIANEGAIFTDYYGSNPAPPDAPPSSPDRVLCGPGCLRSVCLQQRNLYAKDPTIAELLKPQGYATGQFGKNHLGDRNEFLPTVHGFEGGARRRGLQFVGCRSRSQNDWRVRGEPQEVPSDQSWHPRPVQTAGAAGQVEKRECGEQMSGSFAGGSSQ